MKSIFIHTLLSIALISSLSAGSDARRSVTLAYGQSKDDIDIYRIGLKREFQSKWFDSDFGNLGGYYEWSANYWKARNGECNVGASFSPVFVYELNSAYSYIPYLEAGIGISLFSKTSIEKRELSSSFLFEDRIGFGVKRGVMDMGMRYMHYSNANIVEPNDGIDIFLLQLSHSF
jgi:lipid A 3-O-deacylase